MQDLLIITTGGTIDKTYFDALSEFQVGDTAVDRLLRIGDKNSDGKLDAEEFAAGLAGSREKAGSPPEPERPARPDRNAPGPGRLFERLDANGDGKIELDEVPEQAFLNVGGVEQVLAKAKKLQES